MILPGAASSRRRGGQIALYIVPHQDDESLTMGAAILADVAAGHDVYAIIATDGKLDSPRTGATAALIGYTPSYEEFSAARDREFTASVNELGGTPLVSTYAERQPDGSSTAQGIVDLVKSLWTGPTDGSVLLRATSTHDYHSDHRKCGDALVMLYNEGWGTDPRLMLSGWTLDLAPGGATMYEMGAHGDVTIGHQWPYRTHDVPNGWWGIGYASAGSWFDYVIDTNGRTYWHRPVT